MAQAETVSAEALEYTSRLIEKKLSDFGVSVKVLAAYPGPVITRYEIEPAVGVKGSQIVNLIKDLARALSVVAIRVVENPIINQVVFEGNDKVSTKDLTKEVQIKPRAVFTRAKIQADVQRIIELYRRNGKFAARVDPQIIQRPQNRVDLIFSITDGPTTGVSKINFIGF